MGISCLVSNYSRIFIFFTFTGIIIVLLNILDLELVQNFYLRLYIRVFILKKY